MRSLFLAGATGAVGSTLLSMSRGMGVDLVAHARPRPGREPSPDQVVFELSDAAELHHALLGRTTVIQCIGTMRKRFASGDTYESSDVGTTRQLVEAARASGSVDHIVLLSSVGAGKPVGSYLRAKAEAERLVRESNIPWTIFRPSAFVGAGHALPPGVEWLAGKLAPPHYRPIRVEALAAAMLGVACGRSPLGEVLEGELLWGQVTRFNALTLGHDPR